MRGYYPDSEKGIMSNKRYDTYCSTEDLRTNALQCWEYFNRLQDNLLVYPDQLTAVKSI